MWAATSCSCVHARARCCAAGQAWRCAGALQRQAGGESGWRYPAASAGASSSSAPPRPPASSVGAGAFCARPAAAASQRQQARPWSSPRGTARRGVCGHDDGEVVLTQARLEQLLEAEITVIDLRDSQPMNLQSILDSSRVDYELAYLLHEELPVRYAQRIKMLEALPNWKLKKQIFNVREMYVTSFKELRMADPTQPECFREQLRKIKKRHTHTNLLVNSFKDYAQAEVLGEGDINEWLDRFFALRVSTNMLISHYLEISEFPEGRRADTGAEEEMNPYQSSINPQCHPYRIAKHAADVISHLSESWYGYSPEIIVQDAGSQPFPFVPRYLFYIMSELLKNAVRATVEQHQAAQREGLEASMVPITVLVCSGSDIASIRVSDEGGGIPVDQLPHVWSYLYTTAEPMDIPAGKESVDAPTELRRLDLNNLSSTHSLADGDEDQNTLLRSPLAGLGCGLPLSRLYAQYLGGEMVLHTLPTFGTDVFVYLHSLGNHTEDLQSVPERVAFGKRR